MAWGKYTCPNCGGSGRVHGSDCARCWGNGKVNETHKRDYE